MDNRPESFTPWVPVDATLSQHEMLDLSAGVLTLLSTERTSGPLCVVGPSGYPEEEQLDAARSASDPIAIPSNASSPAFFQSYCGGDGYRELVHGDNDDPGP
ncbi:hypothetical protein PGT21_012727 [Puccinia graminis f. sp. tritici]|uniref:Uncharacterized protein n=1 Tax=Puccinia graminis f. sp. tritici TaxID=56615 RepID=A0A5B0Q5N9_PUCGR|nr:hypothetical protein PGT21_012727 [Puccinia graminis f. sp. tritici]